MHSEIIERFEVNLMFFDPSLDIVIDETVLDLFLDHAPALLAHPADRPKYRYSGLSKRGEVLGHQSNILY